MSTALAEPVSAVKTTTKKVRAPKTPKGNSVAQEVIEAVVTNAVNAVIQMPAPEVPVSQPAVQVNNKVVSESAKSTEVNNDGGYSGKLPIYNGQPVFIDRENGVWAFYMNPQAFGFRHERIRNYLMIQDAFAIAEAMGRPLTIEDLKLLVGPDEEEFLCSATRKMFQPMWWVLVTKDLLAQLREGKTLEELDSEEKLTIVGHFFFRNGRVLAYSGTPYRWFSGEKEDRVEWHSPVTIAYKANGHRWPLVRGHAEHLKAARQEKRENLVHMGDEIAKQIGSDYRPCDNGRNNGNRRHYERR